MYHLSYTAVGFALTSLHYIYIVKMFVVPLVFWSWGFVSYYSGAGFWDVIFLRKIKRRFHLVMIFVLWVIGNSLWQKAQLLVLLLRTLQCLNCCGRMSHSVVESLCWSRCQRFGRGNKADENYFFIGAVFSSVLFFLSSVRLKVVFL